MHRCLVIWLLVVVVIASAQNEIVNTTYGPIQGFLYTSDNGIKAKIFLGIPYAKPPVKQLRFEKPVKPDKWTTPLNATSFKKMCYPHDRSSVGNLDECSEDCLYLNIIAPAESNKTAVMVWIHGGGYEAGSANGYRYENIANQLVARNVIMVTIQYRLGPLGFMSSGNKVMPGNLGLWDQTTALDFVKENIVNFGGDSERITVFGLSAGGASTSALTLSPYSQKFFANSIQMSGSVFAEWSSSELVVDASLELAAQLHCPNENFTEMKTCLKNRTVNEFLDAVNKTGQTRDTYKMIKYGPRIDYDFFPNDLETLVKAAQKKPTIIGVSEKEGILFALFTGAKSLSHLYMLPDEFKNYTRDKLIEFIRNKLAMKEDLNDQAEEVQTKIINFYANASAPSGSSYKYWLQKYVKLLTDIMFVIAARKEAELKLQAGWPVWLYITDYYNPTLYDQDWPDKGATHGIEEAFMFKIFYIKEFVFTNNDNKIRDALFDSFTNFAKKSDPSTKSFIWNGTTVEKPGQSLRFQPEPKMEDTMFNENYEFWKTLEIYDYNIITGKRRPNNGESTTTSLSATYVMTHLQLFGFICLRFLFPFIFGH